MTIRVRFLTDYREAGTVRYHAGQHYPPTPLTLAQVRQGAADLADVDIDAKEHAAQAASALDEWNKANERTIVADPAMRNDPNPAATLVKRLLAELA